MRYHWRLCFATQNITNGATESGLRAHPYTKPGPFCGIYHLTLVSSSLYSWLHFLCKKIWTARGTALIPGAWFIWGYWGVILGGHSTGGAPDGCVGEYFCHLCGYITELRGAEKDKSKFLYYVCVGGWNRPALLCTHAATRLASKILL